MPARLGLDVFFLPVRKELLLRCRPKARWRPPAVETAAEALYFSHFSFVGFNAFVVIYKTVLLNSVGKKRTVLYVTWYKYIRPLYCLPVETGFHCRAFDLHAGGPAGSTPHTSKWWFAFCYIWRQPYLKNPLWHYNSLSLIVRESRTPEILGRISLWWGASHRVHDRLDYLAIQGRL